MGKPKDSVKIGEVDKKILKRIIEDLKVTYHMIGEVTRIEKLPKSLQYLYS